MHFDVRYVWKFNVVVIDSAIANKWHRQERPADFAFEIGHSTTVRIVPGIFAGSYKIFANGKHFYDFKFRTGGTYS